MRDRDGTGHTKDSLPVYRDERGALTLMDFDSVPFVPSRAYVLHGIPVGARRGGHAHRRQHRLLAVVSGRASVVEDDGCNVERFEMAAGESLHVAPGVWHELEALDDRLVVLVLASARHDPEDYVTERGELALIAAAQTSST